MARETDLNINVTARDEASQVIRDVKDDVDALEQADATVDVQADDNATETLDKVEGDTKDLDGTKATVDVQADDNATRVLDDIEAKLRDLDGRKASIGVGGAVAAGAAGGAATSLVGDVIAGAQEAGNFAVQVQQIADKTGATRDQASRLALVWRDAGFDLNDLLDILGNIQQVIHDQPDLAQQLGLSNANNTITTLEQIVNRLPAAFDTPGERGRASMQLFGEEGDRQMGQLRVLVGDLGEAMDEISSSRLIKDEDVDAAREISRQAAQARGLWQEAQLFALQTLTAVKGFFEDVHAAGGNQPRLSGTELLNAIGIPSNTAGLTEQDIIARNTGGFSGGIFGEVNRVTSPGARIPHVTVVNNPPGTPATVVEADRTYTRRNDVRYS